MFKGLIMDGCVLLTSTPECVVSPRRVNHPFGLVITTMSNIIGSSNDALVSWSIFGVDQLPVKMYIFNHLDRKNFDES